MSKTIVVDADAIVAQAHPGDANHKKAVAIANHLHEIGAQLIYPTTAIYEAVTVLQHKLSNTATAYGTAVTLNNTSLHIAEVNQQTMNEAMHYFKSGSSKKHTLFDCTVAIIAKQEHADAIFSFDKFYTQQGFTLATTNL